MPALLVRRMFWPSWTRWGSAEVPEPLAPLLGDTGRMHVDPAAIPTLRGLLTELVHREGTLSRIKELVQVGFPWDAPDSMGVTPVQAAGWVRCRVTQVLPVLGPI